MAQLNLKSLIGKLNDTCRRTLEAAAGLCLSRTHYNVEIEHWLARLLDESGTDLEAIFRHFKVDIGQLKSDLNATMDQFKTGNARPPALSPNVVDLAREAWLIGSLEFGEYATRSGHVLCALLLDDSLSRVARDTSDELEKIDPAALMKELPSITADTSEAHTATSSAPAGGAGKGQPVRPSGSSKTPSLDQFTIDLTARAEAGEIDPVLGRDEEIRQVVDILTRRRQNNPIMTGEPGVGKTAVVEGFARRIAMGDVPDALKNVRLLSLDLALLEAGAGVKGEFENRLKSVISEVKASATPIILFIDEAHTMIGAGGQAGQGDAANLLKPALARGELRTIAATTWAEYKKYFERDAALARRFQVVVVEEPSEKGAVEMIRGIADTLEKHHQVRILDSAVVEAVRLSKRYIPGRQLPDKGVSLLDTACARVRMGQAATPAAIEDCQRRLEQIEVETRILNREQLTGGEHAERLEELRGELETETQRHENLQAQWEKEKDLVDQIRALRDSLEGINADGTEAAELPDDRRSELRGELDRLNLELEATQGEQPLIQVCVDVNAISEIVSNWTGIPVGRMVSNEILTILNLKQKMEERVVGQSHGLEQIAQAIRTSRAKLTDPRRPIGVFMLAGPSGVGKTETALCLADLLYGGEQNMTVINMSEYKEEHKVSLLMGSPPGYVGFGEGGVLTEGVRRKPYSVVLLDELEKAHEGVQEIFYQVFDKGILRDGEGRDIDFKNTIIIMTSNAGTDLIAKLCADPETAPDPEDLATALHEELLKTFKPAFLGRINIIPYYPLSEDVMRNIIHLKLGSIVQRIRQNYRASLDFTPAVVENILGRCTEVESGARNVDHILNGTLLPEMSSEFLSRMAEGGSVAGVKIDVGENGKFSYEIS
jgi:type VI secretion system protein VasG